MDMIRKLLQRKSNSQRRPSAAVSPVAKQVDAENTAGTTSGADADFSRFEQQIQKLTAIFVALGEYAKKRARLGEDGVELDKGYLKLMQSLTRYQDAILLILGRAGFGENEVLEAASTLEPVDPATAAQLRETVPMIRQVIPPRDAAKRACIGLLMRNTNVLADLAQSLIKAGELRERGMAEKDIVEFMESWEPEKIF